MEIGNELSMTVNSIEETSKLSKQSKKNSKYTKLSTDENSIEPLEIKIEKEDVVSSTSNSEDFVHKNPFVTENFGRFFYKSLGNTFAFFGDKYGNPLIIIGPHWPMYFCFIAFVIGGFLLFFYAFWIDINTFFKVSGIIVLGIFWCSYTYTFLINPGYPKHDLDSQKGEPRENFRFCDRCRIWINIKKNTNHCFDCDICIEGYDHHCPWTSKCIGRRNKKMFFIFIISTLFCFAYIICALTNAQSIRMSKRNKKFLRF